MAAARPQFRLGPKIVTRRGGRERTVSDFVERPGVIEGRAVRSMESIRFANGSFDVKLNVNMSLTKRQGEGLKADLERLVLPDFRKGIKKKGFIALHFDSSDLAENSTRTRIIDPVIDPALGFTIPPALLARSYKTSEVGIYVESSNIPLEPSNEEKFNIVFQFGRVGRVDRGKICYNGRVTLNIHLVRAKMSSSGTLINLEDGRTFQEKLKSLFDIFFLFLDPGTRIIKADRSDVNFDALFGKVAQPLPPVVPQAPPVVPFASVGMAVGGVIPAPTLAPSGKS